MVDWADAALMSCGESSHPGAIDLSTAYAIATEDVESSPYLVTPADTDGSPAAYTITVVRVDNGR
jgi:hypothetical protein